MLPLLFKVTAPVRTLFCVKVIVCAPALKLAVPGTVNMPVCVIAPPAVKTKFPLLVKAIAGKVIAALSKVKVKLRKLVNEVKLGTNDPVFISRMFTSRILLNVPPKIGNDVPRSLACDNKISEFNAVTERVVATPLAINAPVCVILPPAVTLKLPPTVEAPNTNAALLIMLTALLPVLFKLTAPVNTLLRVRVIGLAPALKLAVPGIVKIPVCVIAPLVVTVRFLPKVEAANINALPLVILTSLLPELLSVTAPTKLLFWVKVIGLAPALKLEVLCTDNAPVCVIGPPAVATNAPAFVNVIDGNTMAALLKVMVILRTLVNPVKLGIAALALILRRFIS